MEMKPHSFQTLMNDLKSCTARRDLQMGKRIHAKAVESGHDSDMYVATALIRMYGKCGSMTDAHRIFDGVRKPQVACWNVLLLGYTENGNGHFALDLFARMKESGYAPDSITFVAALKACSSLALGNRRGDCLQMGRGIHSDIGFRLNIYVQNTLVAMYSKCGSMSEARRVFDSIRGPDVMSWNVLILGYAENRDGLAALELFSSMKARRCSLDSLTYVAVLKACISLAVNANDIKKGECLEFGREIHSEIRLLDFSVQSTLIGMYAKCGSMVEARQVFDGIQKPDVVSWTALILGYAENGQGLTALNLFSTMKTRGCAPDSVAYVAVLKACIWLAVEANGSHMADWLERGRQIHSEIGQHLDYYVQSTLIDMYSRCDSMVEARQVFDGIKNPNVVCWNVLLMGYAENGEGKTSLDLFSKMRACHYVPDAVTYVAAFKACSYLAVDGDGSGKSESLEQGRKIHSKVGCCLNYYVQNALIDMYAKCGSMVESRCVFDHIRNPDVVSWTALLLGYVENGEALTALDLFLRMKALHGAPNPVTYIAAFKACGLIGALALGRKFHSDISEFTANLVTCLVDFYSKCGSMIEAREVFDLHSTARVVSTWNALLAGYGGFGDTVCVFNLFEAMQDQGFQPDVVTFLSMLSCCSHAGLVDKARKYLEAMPVQYGVNPTVMHYNCMVDMLGRGNQLNEAITVLEKMPCSPDAVTWMTLLGACRKWKNVEIGKWAFQSLVDMGKKNTSAYVLMAHIYSSRGMWEEQEKVLETSIELDPWKLPEQSYVVDDVGNMVKFAVGEEDPLKAKNQLKQLLQGNSDESVYIAESYSVSCNVADAKILCGHSERRAVVYSILTTATGESVRAFKNMRMCDDCHGSTKMISKLSGRVIMVRDTSRFHVMVNGNCSCGDYW